jgi:hypothetical protein
MVASAAHAESPDDGESPVDGESGSGELLSPGLEVPPSGKSTQEGTVHEFVNPPVEQENVAVWRQFK